MQRTNKLTSWTRAVKVSQRDVETAFAFPEKLSTPEPRGFVSDSAIDISSRPLHFELHVSFVVPAVTASLLSKTHIGIFVNSIVLPPLTIRPFYNVSQATSSETPVPRITQPTQQPAPGITETTIEKRVQRVTKARKNAKYW
ncbi:hypothetical protein HDU98_006086, partial [Podochytrium sp. JEL0797]